MSAPRDTSTTLERLHRMLFDAVEIASQTSIECPDDASDYLDDTFHTLEEMYDLMCDIRGVTLRSLPRPGDNS
jgi:hypothetical protein